MLKLLKFQNRGAEMDNILSFKIAFANKIEKNKLKHLEKERIKIDNIKNYQRVEFVPPELPSVKRAKFFCKEIYDRL